MSDPYDILGVQHDATFEDIRTAYRRACKTKHPDMGGSQAEFVELQNAYEHILNELKRGYGPRSQDETGPASESAHREEPRAEPRWEDIYRDIDDELEELRRTARAREEQLRAMRTEAWGSGSYTTWATLTGQDVTNFFGDLLRGGIRGLALLFAALIGIGSILLQFNVIAALITVSAGLGLLIALAAKYDRTRMLPAGLVGLVILAVLWLPVRDALWGYAIIIVVLLCFALILKLTQRAGLAGFVSGIVVALVVIAGMVSGGGPQEPQASSATKPSSPLVVPPQVPSSKQAAVPPSEPAKRPPSAGILPPSKSPSTPEAKAPEPPRSLLAANGSVLKIVAGVPYQLRVRTGFTTLLQASEGRVALYLGERRMGDCVDALRLFAERAASPYADIEHTLRACNVDAVLRVIDVR